MEEEERVTDRISSLPDDVLGDIVSLLPTKAGGRTQILSSRWRHIWRSAPLNIDLHLRDPAERLIPVDKIIGVLSAHRGPGRRFSIAKNYLSSADTRAALDRWLQSPALDNLQELGLNLNGQYPQPLPPASVHRFSSTLRVASFGGFNFAGSKALHLPLLEKLTLSDVTISEDSLHAMLAACPALQSLLLMDSYGFRILQIVSRSLRSIGVRSGWYGVKLQEILLVDAPSLQRVLFFERRTKIKVAIFSAPRLDILGEYFDSFPKVRFRNPPVLQGSTCTVDSSKTPMIHSVKVLAICDVNLSLDAVLELLKSFPNLEKLYINGTCACVENTWYDKYKKLIGTIDIRLREIVLANYQGSKSHINFVKFFVSIAKALKSIRLESGVGNMSKAWIARQRRLLSIKKRASRAARFNFASPKISTSLLDVLHVEQAHDLSLIDPFQRFD